MIEGPYGQQMQNVLLHQCKATVLVGRDGSPFATSEQADGDPNQLRCIVGTVIPTVACNSHDCSTMRSCFDGGDGILEIDIDTGGTAVRNHRRFCSEFPP